MHSDIKVIAPRRDTVVWITPKDLRAVASRMERNAKRSKGHFGCYSVGKESTGMVYFQYEDKEAMKRGNDMV